MSKMNKIGKIFDYKNLLNDEVHSIPIMQQSVCPFYYGFCRKSVISYIYDNCINSYLKKP